MEVIFQSDPVSYTHLREIRVMVSPEKIDDARMELLAKDIADQIETELAYPGQIRVSVIRESRVVEYAK